jgi:hypothetical protein
MLRLHFTGRYVVRRQALHPTLDLRPDPSRGFHFLRQLGLVPPRPRPPTFVSFPVLSNVGSRGRSQCTPPVDMSPSTESNSTLPTPRQAWAWIYVPNSMHNYTFGDPSLEPSGFVSGALGFKLSPAHTELELLYGKRGSLIHQRPSHVPSSSSCMMIRLAHPL